jgi:hypothetical protein
MRNHTSFRKFMAWLATGAVMLAISGPLPFSARAVATGNAQKKYQAARRDKTKLQRAADQKKRVNKGEGNSGNNARK